MFKKKRLLVLPILLGALATVMVLSDRAEANRGDGALGVVYVESQGLYFDTFVAAQELPPVGRFQLLVNGTTEYGPGDRDYVGGRWMVPDGNGGFRYFLCPLLGPGRETP